MLPDPKWEALAGARRAQGRYEKTRSQLQSDGQSRRESFERARDAGATLREIGNEVGLHWTRIREILSGR